MKQFTLSEAILKYGDIVNGKWDNELKFMTVLKIPSEISSSWINSANNKPVNKIYCNVDLAPHLMAALENLKNSNLLSELKTFDGCFQIRFTRGSIYSLSTHSYGLAIDINAKENQLNQEPKLTAQFVECFTKEGFTWGGNFTRKDGMHFSRAWE